MFIVEVRPPWLLAEGEPGSAEWQAVYEGDAPKSTFDDEADANSLAQSTRLLIGLGLLTSTDPNRTREVRVRETE